MRISPWNDFNFFIESCPQPLLTPLGFQTVFDLRVATVSALESAIVLRILTQYLRSP